MSTERHTAFEKPCGVKPAVREESGGANDPGGE